MKSPEIVFLLHGLCRTARSMTKIENALKHAGYLTVNINYPSRLYLIENLAEIALSDTLKQYPHAKIHFITHSLGGILVRYYLSKHKVKNLGRVVMLSPPNQGSEIADKLRHLWIYKIINGKAGQQLGTNKADFLCKLGKAHYNLGIITGNKSINCLLSLLIDGENDGKVSVNKAKLEGMNDFLVMPVNHSFIMINDKVIQQCCYFLQNGYFYATSKNDQKK